MFSSQRGNKSFLAQSLPFVDGMLRVSTVAVRAFFTLVAAKFLDGASFGAYVAVQANISIYQYVVALDFSYVAQRKLLQKKVTLASLLGTQLPILVVFFAISNIFLFFTLPRDVQGTQFWVFSTLLLLESGTAELQRYLVAIRYFTFSNVILFVKSAGWMIFFTLYHFKSGSLITLKSIFNFWLIGNGIALLIGIIAITKKITGPLNLNRVLMIDFFRTMPIVILGTLSSRAFFSVDRIIVEKIDGVYSSGIYGFYVGMAAAFISVLDGFILLRSYPVLVKIASAKKWNAYRRVVANINTRIFLFTACSLFLYKLMVYRVLAAIDKLEFYSYNNLGVVLIAAYALYGLSFPLGLVFYASHRDKFLSILNLMSLVPFLFVFHYKSPAMEVIPYMILVTLLVNYLVRLFVLKLSIKKWII